MNILFVCTENVGRSIMAEFMARHLFGEEKYRFISGGVNIPKKNDDFTRALVVETLKEFDVVISPDYVSHHVTEFDIVEIDKIVCFSANAWDYLKRNGYYNKTQYFYTEDPVTRVKYRSANDLREAFIQTAIEIRNHLRSIIIWNDNVLEQLK